MGEVAVVDEADGDFLACYSGEFFDVVLQLLGNRFDGNDSAEIGFGCPGRFFSGTKSYQQGTGQFAIRRRFNFCNQLGQICGRCQLTVVCRHDFCERLALSWLADLAQFEVVPESGADSMSPAA